MAPVRWPGAWRGRTREQTRNGRIDTARNPPIGPAWRATVVQGSRTVDDRRSRVPHHASHLPHGLRGRAQRYAALTDEVRRRIPAIRIRRLTIATTRGERMAEISRRRSSRPPVWRLRRRPSRGRGRGGPGPGSSRRSAHGTSRAPRLVGRRTGGDVPALLERRKVGTQRREGHAELHHPGQARGRRRTGEDRRRGIGRARSVHAPDQDQRAAGVHTCCSPTRTAPAAGDYFTIAPHGMADDPHGRACALLVEGPVLQRAQALANADAERRQVGIDLRAAARHLHARRAAGRRRGARRALVQI